MGARREGVEEGASVFADSVARIMVDVFRSRCQLKCHGQPIRRTGGIIESRLVHELPSGVVARRGRLLKRQGWQVSQGAVAVTAWCAGIRSRSAKAALSSASLGFFMRHGGRGSGVERHRMQGSAEIWRGAIEPDAKLCPRLAVPEPIPVGVDGVVGFS